MQKTVWVCLGITFVTLLVYYQTLSFDFVNYDDRDHVYGNLDLRLGLSPAGVTSAFSSLYVGNWAPVTWLTYHADYALHGYSPGGYHLTNMLFHLANALLVFALLRIATGSLWPSVMTALVFAVHPLHVESVAWISERKDVVCTFFSLLTLIAYILHARQPSRWRFAAVCLFLILALMAKPMAVTIPCVLILMDYWPLNRWTRKPGYEPVSTKQIFNEKLPLFGIVFIFSAITVWVQTQAQAVSGTDVFSVPVRVANALNAYGVYLFKTIFPIGLIPFYPHPADNVSWILAAGTGLALLIISILVYLHRGTRPYMLVGWCWFMGTLVPVIGLVQVGGQAHADRYMYFPIIGLSIMVFWGLYDKYGIGSVRPRTTVICLMVLGVYTVMAHTQTSRWKNSITLFEYTLTHSPDNLPALGNLGEAYLTQGDPEIALPYIQRAVELAPNQLGNLRNLGQAHRDLGNLQQSMLVFRQALAQDENDPSTLNQLGITLLDLGRPHAALPFLEKAIEQDASHLNARLNRGNALLATQRVPEAMADYRYVLERNPNLPEAYSNLGAAYLMEERYAEAAEQIRVALSLRPDDPAALINLAVAEWGMGNADTAEQLCLDALRINPEFSKGKQFLRYLQQGGGPSPLPPPPIGDIPSMLPGHTWQAGDLTLIFQDGDNVLVQGGHLTDTMPTGAPSRYTLKNGALHLEVLGRTYEGSWDGKTLVIGTTVGIYRGKNKGNPAAEMLE